MAKNKSVYDVFITFDFRTGQTASEILAALRSRGIAAYCAVDDSAAGDRVADSIWEALAESQAIVAAIEPGHSISANMAVEMGAAKAWNKPIYAVVRHPTASELPSYFQDMQVYPMSRVGELADEILHSSDPLAEEDLSHLARIYSEVGVAADQLALQPQSLSVVTSKFNQATSRSMSGEQVLRNLLRARKSGKLRALKKRAQSD